MTERKSPSKKPDAEYSSAQAVLNNQLGHDPVLEHMIQRKLPLTAETYITLNWGNLPDEIDPEDQELLDALRVLEKA
jgi:hypothetical protein